MRRATEKDLFGPRGGAAVQQRRQVSANGGVLNKEPQLSRAAEVRKVEAAIGMSGMDISQKYDAFGNNSFSSADNPWMAFFGAPTAPWKTTSYDKYDRHNYSLPEAYVGQNKTLAQTIDELIYNEETFYTTELLPFSFTDQISVQWDKIEFNEHFTGIVPEQGVSRLVSSHRTQHSESFLRRGLAAIFEHGFMSTPQGRANYFLTLAQIARAVQETINFGVIYAYLTCHNYAKQWEEKHGYFRSQTLAELLERDNFMWAIAVKTEFGMEKLDAQIVEWMNRYRATADTWVLPPKPAMYLRLVPEEKVYYYKAGQEGPDRVNNILGAGRPHESNSKRIHDVVEPYAVFKKNNVFLTRTYHVERTGPIDLMTRVSSVGEFFKIVKGSATIDYRTGYTSALSDTRIYDEDGDCGYTVSKAEAITYTQVFDENGKPRVPRDNISPADAKDMDGVFFLRRVIDPVTQQDTYVPIEYCGDINPLFFGVRDVSNLAHAAIASVLTNVENRRAAHDALVNGLRLINAMAAAPLVAGQYEVPAAGTVGVDVAALAGQTSWIALQQIASRGFAGISGPIEAFVRTVEEIATVGGNMMGGSNNLFLNPENALPIPGYQPGNAARALYENVLNYRAVPVYRFDDVNNVDIAAGSEAGSVPGLAQAYAYLSQALLDPQADAATLATRKLTPLSLADLAAVRGSLLAPANANRDAYQTLRAQVLGHPEWTKAKTQAEIKQYVAELDASLASAPRRAGGAVAGVRARSSVSTTLAVSETNPSVVDGSARAAGFALASRFNVLQPRDAYETTVGQGAVELVGMRLEDIPLIRGLMGAQAAGNDVGRKGASSYSTQQSSLHYADDVDAPLESYFESEPIGRLVDDRDARGQARVSEAINSSRVWMPSAGVQLRSQAVNLRFGTLGQNLDLLASSTLDPLAKLVAALYYGAPWLLETLVGFEESGIPAPCGILGFRVGLYDMALGIKCKAGSETGASYFGHSDFMLADDATIKIHYGNYTHYGKSVVHKPENVFIAYDIFPNRCLGGMGVSPYRTRDQFVPEDQQFLADIFYIMVPYTEINFPKVMSMAGRFYTYMDAGMLDEEDPANRALHYSTAPYYNRYWGWYSEQEIVPELDEPMYRINNPGVNTNVWQGAQGTWNPDTKKFDKDIIRNKSPWGVTAEGCKASRNGQMERVPTVAHGVLGF